MWKAIYGLSLFNFFWGGSNYKTNGVHHAGELGTQRTETSKYTYYKLFSCVCMNLFLNSIKIYYIFFIRYRYTITKNNKQNSLELADVFNQMIATNISYLILIKGSYLYRFALKLYKFIFYVKWILVYQHIGMFEFKQRNEVINSIHQL